jgi:hypothetical protein
VELYLHSPVCLHGAQIKEKHRDIFTFTFKISTTRLQHKMDMAKETMEVNNANSQNHIRK